MSSPSPSVLLVEDNAGDAELVRLRLEEGDSHAEVDCVSRLSDGLAHLGRKRPSVVLLDLNLPDSQGVDTFRRVLETAPNVPVVILSGQNDEALAMDALNHGVQDNYQERFNQPGTVPGHAFCHSPASFTSLPRRGPTTTGRIQEATALRRFRRTRSAVVAHPSLCDEFVGGHHRPAESGAARPSADHHRCVDELKTILGKLRDASLSASEKLRAEQQWLAAADLAGQSLAAVIEQIHRKPQPGTGGEERDLLFALCDPESFLNKR